MTRQDFRTHAKPVKVTINGVDFLADPKEFTTGSLGWNISEKTVLEVNGDPLHSWGV